MTRFLLLGFSSIARRRVLPALAAIGIHHLDVASISAADAVQLPGEMDGRIFANYHTALSQSTAEIVYISTINSLHAQLAFAALNNERHVVIDKPATTNLADTERLISLAQKKNRLLAEATVYNYHPQIDAALDVFTAINSRPTRIMASFSFPRLPADNFRYNKAMGGGAVWDLGPYAVTPGRIFFQAAPVEIVSRQFAGSEDNVETGFSLLAIYSGQRSFVGHYGMGTGYVNQMTLLGPNATVTLNRVFSPPADMICELQVNQSNVRRTLTVSPADSFANFLQAIVKAIKNNTPRPFAEVMLADAIALDRLRS
ncbi:MAG: Gfo/Idh/MocA family oxidoreductase [Candidatus Promineifilaceae bacterium]|nr:Gfo/Idh/MocA family oxidoreductase [Candidatus Promineifilaceae bacterium]